jgi:leucyl aminopeptidase
MLFQIVSSFGQRKVADVLVLPYFQQEKKCASAFDRKLLQSDLLPLLEKDFSAKEGELLFSYAPEEKEKKVLLVGLGRQEKENESAFRKAFALALQFCRKSKLKTLNLIAPSYLTRLQCEALLDGLSMANYSYDQLKKESLRERPSFLVEKIYLIGAAKTMQPLVARNHHLMSGVNLARSLVNGNADEVKAPYLAEMVKTLAKEHSHLTVKILGRKELEKEGMGLMLAVNRGSTEDPALIVLEYKGDPKAHETAVILGKGVSFDTGGLNLKPTGSMETMKSDMAGAAAVIGMIQACAALKLKKHVIGVIGSVENAIGPNSYKPGDVYVSHFGKSIEISNTDAEGRLVLADALSYVQKHYKPSYVIDVATLTGGVIVALGDEAAGLFSNQEALKKQIEEASKRTGERVWALPLYPEYLDSLKSSIADLKNARSNRKASAGTAAMFLKQFVQKDLPWAHLDIAGTAYLSELSAYHPTHATGFGVKLLISLLDPS